MNSVEGIPGWQMSCDYTEISWIRLGGKWSLIEVCKNLWGLVHSNIVVWEEIGGKT